MILYFANRRMEILGQASTELPKGYVITEDLKTEEIETGVATFSCRIGFENENRANLEAMTEVGNYLLRSHDGENEFYTIIDSEIDTKNQDIYIYAEDAGLDLINEIAPEFEASASQSAEWYINKYILDSGFEIGINEIPASSTRKLKWEGESTVTERLASIATGFGGYEISFSFEIKGLIIAKKYVNIFKERGKNFGEHLRLNRDIDRIKTIKSVANLATAFICEGGTPDDAEDPITLKGYSYDDGDFYVGTDGILRSRKAVEKWSRYVWNNEPNRLNGYAGHIVGTYSYDTTDKATLCSHAIAELKKICDMEINFEIDIKKLPEGVKIGDRINIVDDAGGLYVSTRILKLESSVVDDEQTATLGEHLIKTSGISQKVADLAEQFAAESRSAARALVIANNAKNVANEALEQSETAEISAENAQTAAQDAANAAQTATNSALTAATAASNAQSAVETVNNSVKDIENTVNEAQAAVVFAQQAAASAENKALEAMLSATTAVNEAQSAAISAGNAEISANKAAESASDAEETAGNAMTEAVQALTTANAAKADSAQAQEDIAVLGENLTTLSNTMSADYARKTDLTEASSSLQSQISQNATKIQLNVQSLTTIDETANNALEQAQAAQNTASEAQTKANQAKTEAEAAKAAALTAATAASNAQTEADNAKAAAEAAQSVANKAETDLAAAKANLDAVSSRVDATEEEIAAAQNAVNTAQAAADKAKEDAANAAQVAETAQGTANTAVANAAKAQTKANEAASAAAAAQETANKAVGDASAAQTAADEAAAVALAAQTKANTAFDDAAAAQNTANEAATAAASATNAAKAADDKAKAAQEDLNTAKQNLAAVSAKADATEEEVAKAQEDVIKAQAAADKAKEDAATAQTAADTAKANAATAQAKADQAAADATAAQNAADEAKAAADTAQAAVDALAVRVTAAETNITQTNAQIALMATKTEVAQTLGGYYTKTEADAQISVKADEIAQTVTTEKIEALDIGGRNLATKEAVFYGTTGTYSCDFVRGGCLVYTAEILADFVGANEGDIGEDIVLSFDIKLRDGGISRALSVYPYQYSGVSIRNDSLITPTAEWQRFVFKTQVKRHAQGYYENGKPYSFGEVYIWDTVGTNAFTVRNIQIERGNKATDWKPAPEDMSDEIDALADRVTTNETAIEQNGEQISLRVTETEFINGLNNIKVGGRNLIPLKSISSESCNFVASGTDYISVGNVTSYAGSALVFERIYPAGEYTLNYSLTRTTKYRLLCSVQLPNFIANTTYNSYGVGYYCDITVPYTFTLPETAKLGIVISGSSSVTTETISDLKLEKGNKATDWTAAPEDLESGRNLIFGTGTLGTVRWERAAGENTERGYHAMTNKDSSENTPGQYLTEVPRQGMKYTISAKMRGNANLNLYRIASGGNSALSWVKKEDMSETEFRKFTFTFEPHKEQLTGIYIVTKYGEDNTPVGTWFEIEEKSLKLELGSNATDWTAAPEELPESVAGAQTTANDALYKATTAESQIELLKNAISMLVTDENGTSLMTQTANGWTFSTSSIQNAVNDVFTSLGELSGDYDNSKDILGELQTKVGNIASDIRYVHMGEYNYTNDSGEAVTEICLELGEKGSDYKVIITNTQILFKIGSATPTRINAEGLVTENITVENELRHSNKAASGCYVWEMDENGYLGLYWKGANE